MDPDQYNEQDAEENICIPEIQHAVIKIKE